MALSFQYCPFCRVALQPFSDGERLRSRCPDCGWVHYRNPTVGVAVVLLRKIDSEKALPEILLGLRRDGSWCIPCGHVEWDESIQEAALREFQEETGLHVRLDDVLSVLSNFHNPAQHTVGVWFMGEEIGGQLRPGGDVQDVGYFPIDDVPQLAFPTDRIVIQQLLQELTPSL